MFMHADQSPRLMLEQDYQEHATKRPGNATWQSSFVACMVILFLTTALYSALHVLHGIKSLIRSLLWTSLSGRETTTLKESCHGSPGDRKPKPASPHKHTRERRRAALYSDTVPKPRGKAFKRCQV